MDVELIDLTLDEEDEGYHDDTSSSIYSLATLPTKRESAEFAELEEMEADCDCSHGRRLSEESDERAMDGGDLEHILREEEEMEEMEEIQRAEIELAVAKQLEMEQEAWEEYEQMERQQRLQQQQQLASAEEVARALDHEADAATAAASPATSPPFIGLTFDAPAEADIGISGDIPCDDGTSEQQSTILCDVGSVSVRAIPRDGHCLYRACLHQRLPPDRRHQLPPDEEVAALRREVASYMREHRESLRDFFTDEDHQNSIEHSIDLVEDGGWGDSTSLYVVASMWTAPIQVFMEYGPTLTTFPAGQTTIGTSPSAPAPPLRIAYRCAPDADGQPVYNHYDSVVEVRPDREQPEPCPAPSATPSPPAPRSATSSHSRCSLSSRTARRQRSPAASPRKRLCSGAGQDTSLTASLVSQEGVHPASPTPGAAAPGSPNAECLSASQPSQQPSQEEATQVEVEELLQEEASQVEEDEDEALQEDDMEGLRATAFSPALGCPLSPVSYGARLLPLSSEPLTSERRAFGMVPELTGEQRAREWILSQHLEERSGTDEEFENAADELLELLEEEDEETERRDVATGISTVFGVVTNMECVPSKAGVIRLSLKRDQAPPKTRTVSTNVVLSCGTLAGTFQVLDT